MLDLQTCLHLVILIGLFLTLAMAFFWLTLPTYAGFRHWIAGIFLISLGYLALLLRGWLPLWANVILMSCVVVSGPLVRLDGSRRFLGLGPLPRVYLGLPALLTFINLADAYWGGHLAWRSSLVLAPIALMALVHAAIFWIRAPRGQGTLHRAVAVLMVLVALELTAYTAMVFQRNPSYLFQYQDVFAAHLVGTVLHEIGITLLLMMITSQRTAAILRSTQARLTGTVNELKRALAEVRTLSGLVPICAGCKKVRDDQGYWRQIEQYLAEHSQAEFSHGYCPDCLPKYFPQLAGIQTKPEA